MLISYYYLHLPSGESRSFLLTLRHLNVIILVICILFQITVLIAENQSPYNPNEPVVTSIKFVKENKMGESIHFYNILFRRIMEKLGLLEINRHFFDYRTSHQLPSHR